MKPASGKLSVLLCPFGSEGDVYPLVWAAGALAARGHRPHMLLAPGYGKIAQKAGIPWTPVGTDGEFETMVRDPGFWHPLSGPARVMQAMVDTFPRYLDAWDASGSSPDLAIVSSLGFAAACAAEARSIPHLMIHMQPTVILSRDNPPVFNHWANWLARLPRAVRGVAMGAAEAGMNLLLLNSLNKIRSGMGLPPWRSTYREGLMGGLGIGLMAPEWFAPRQADWPENITQFGFPLPQGPPPPLDPTLAAFLHANNRPVVWTHGSANYDTSRFWKWAITASQTAGVPFVLIGPQAPAAIPTGGVHFAHAPFETLFPLARAVVHHGGIGTTAKAIAAGIPQMVIPRSHDQPDNACRVEQLGLGLHLPYPFNGTQRTTRTLTRLLNSDQILAACRETSLYKIDADPQAFADWVENILAR